MAKGKQDVSKGAPAFAGSTPGGCRGGAGFVDAVLSAALAAELPGVVAEISESDRPDLCDYQSNFAFKAAAAAGTTPAELAGRVAARICAMGSGVAAEAAGCGFLNMRIADGVLPGLAREAAENPFPDLSGRSVMVDYASPNCAKAMHVGHLRSVVIGDAVCGMLEASGARVGRVNHVGDFGTPFGMMAALAVEEGFDHAGAGVGEWEDLYRRARARFDGDRDFAARALAAVGLIQRGEGPEAEVWRAARDSSLSGMDATLSSMGSGLRPGDTLGESAYAADLAPAVDGLLQRGVLEESDGAACFFSDRGNQPLVLRKSGDGGHTYAATDLCAFAKRAGEGWTDVVYVVDARQAGHFASLFELCQRAGLSGATAPFHAGFGVMTGPGGGPFKTRDGGVPSLTDLLSEAVAKARAVAVAKGGSPSDDEVMATGVGALRYADVSRPRTGDVPFDPDAMLSMEGDTASYLQYAAARARSVLERASGLPLRDDVPDASGRALLLEIAKVPWRVSQGVAALRPDMVCQAARRVAAAFSTFYSANRVVSEGTASKSGVEACAMVSGILDACLGSLWIASPERMPGTVPSARKPAA